MKLMNKIENILEAKNDLTVVEIGTLERDLVSLKRTFGPDGSDEPNTNINKKDGTFSVEMTYRNRDFFTARPGEEDDDNPTFTGKKEILKRLKNHIGDELKGLNIEVFDNEKSWFSIIINGKADVKGLDLPHNERPLHLIATSKEGVLKANDALVKLIQDVLKTKWAKWQKTYNDSTELKEGNSFSDAINVREDMGDQLSLSIKLPVGSFKIEGDSFSYKYSVSASTFRFRSSTSVWSVHVNKKGTRALANSESIFNKEGSLKKSTLEKLASQIIKGVTFGMKDYASVVKDRGLETSKKIDVTKSGTKTVSRPRNEASKLISKFNTVFSKELKKFENVELVSNFSSGGGRYARTRFFATAAKFFPQHTKGAFGKVLKAVEKEFGKHQKKFGGDSSAHIKLVSSKDAQNYVSLVLSHTKGTAFSIIGVSADVYEDGNMIGSLKL